MPAEQVTDVPAPSAGLPNRPGFLLSRPVPAAAIDELLAAPAPLLPLSLAEGHPSVQLA